MFASLFHPESDYPDGYSKLDRAADLCGLRPTDVVPFDEPPELGFHCPVCEYENLVDGNYDERLTWSEYKMFLWCSVCNRDYPSVLCVAELFNYDKPQFLDVLARQTSMFLDCIEQAQTADVDPPAPGVLDD